MVPVQGATLRSKKGCTTERVMYAIIHDQKRKSMAQHHEKYWSQFYDYLEQRSSQLRSNTAKSDHYIEFMIDTNVGIRTRQVIRPQPGDADLLLSTEPEI